MIPVAWDTETARFGPGRQAPPLACVSLAYEGGEGLVHWTEAEELFEELLYDDEYLLIGHNIAYDFAVIAAMFPHFLGAIFRAFEKGRVRDTMIRQKLLDNTIGRFRGYLEPIPEGERRKRLEASDEAKKKGKKGKVVPHFRWKSHRYNLDDTYFRCTKKRLDKDTWRTGYGELRDKPLEQWPAGAREYSVQDARATWQIYHWQERQNEEIKKRFGQHETHIDEAEPLCDEAAQCRAAWWIHLMKCWGIRTAPERVALLNGEVDREYKKCEKLLIQKHLVRLNGTRDTKAAKARMIAIMGGIDKCRKTKTNDISLSEEACKASGDLILQEYSQLSSLKAVKSKDIPMLMKGRWLPVHSNFDSFVATGRTSSSKPNIQNIRRLEGIRECFVPRDGMVFLDADYDGLELRTLAQVCMSLFGFSRLGEALNAGRDPHIEIASELLHCTYEEAEVKYNEKDDEADNARQTGKVANFGFPGGLGYEALIFFARKTYGVKITEDEAKALKRLWLRKYPEMELYFSYINNLCNEDKLEGTAMVRHLFTNRIRGFVPYTVACNSLFQGLGGDATKNAGFLIARACYLDKNSPLYGCRIVNYIHDQFIVECPEARANAAAWELARLMVLGAEPFLKDVAPLVSKPVVTRCWSKKAKQVFKHRCNICEFEEGKEDGWCVHAQERELIPWDTSFVVKQKKREQAVA